MVSLIKLDFSFEILKEKSLFLVNLAYFRKEEKKKKHQKKNNSQIQSTFRSLWSIVAKLGLNFGLKSNCSVRCRKQKQQQKKESGFTAVGRGTFKFWLAEFAQVSIPPQ